VSAIVRPFVDAESPWPGLFPYSEESSRFFNGRERETAELLRLVRRDTLCLLYGQSGLGKSSLIQAGLFPRLRQEALLPVYVRLDFAARDLDLRSQFWQVFTRVLDGQDIDARRPSADDSLWEYFNDAALEFWDSQNRALTPVLVLDQFEEVFTRGGNRGTEPAEGSFLRELGDLIDARVPASVHTLLEDDPGASARFHFGTPRFRVLIGFREDFLPEFDDLFRALRLPAGSRLRLARMREEQALEAVRRTGGRLVDGEVAAQIVAFVSGRESAIRARTAEVEPALLSVVCYELNNRRRARGEPHISSALLSGARDQIIEEFYHRSLAGTPYAVREFVEEELLTESGYRDSAAIDDALKRPGVTEEAIRDLVEKRVVRLEERFGVLRIELTHDILAPVVRRDRDERQERLRLEAERERERVRQRRSRRLTRIAAAAVAGATGLVVVFAVLLQRAEQEKARAIQAQSSLFLSRAVAGLEQNVPREPYRSLVQAIALDRGNRAAAARAVSLLTQRRFPVLEVALPLNANAVRQLGELPDGRLAFSRDGVLFLFGWAAKSASEATVEVSCLRESLATVGDDPFVLAAPLPLRRAGTEEGPPRDAEWQYDAAAWSTSLSQAATSCARPVPPARVAGKKAGDKPAAETGEKAPPEAARRVGFDAATVTAAYATTAGDLIVVAANGRRETISLGNSDSPPIVVALDSARRRVFAAHADGAVELLPLPGGTDRRATIVPAGSAAATTRLQVSPNGEQLLVVGSAARPTMQLWRLKDPRQLTSATLDDPDAVRFSASGAWLARIAGGAVEFVDPDTGKVAGRVARALAFNHVAMHEREDLALISSQDRTATVVRVPSGEAVGPAMMHEGAVTESGFGPDGTVLTASFDGTVREWYGGTREPAIEPFLHRGPVIWVRALPDGRVASLAEDQHLRLWRRAGGPPAGSMQADRSTGVELSRDGRLAARIAADGTLEAARVRAAVGGSALEAFRTVSSNMKVETPFTLGADGSAIAWTSEGRTVGWAFGDGQRKGGSARLPYRVLGLDIAHDGSLVAALLEDGSIRVIDTRTGRPSGLPALTHRRIMAWGISDDGSHLLVAGETALQMFDARTGYLLASRPFAGGVSADVARGSAGIAYSTGRELAVWIPGPRGPNRLRLPALATTVRFSPDGTRLLTASVDGRVQVRDAKTLQELGPALRHSNAVVSAEFSPDGAWVVTTSLDGAIRVWDPASGQAVSDPLRARSGNARAVVAGDGNWMAIVAGDGAPVEWRPLAIGFPAPLPPWFEGFYGSLSGLAGAGEMLPQAPEGERARAPESWATWWKDWKTLVEGRQRPPGGV
jgi:WD40 repeat protein